MLMLSRKSGQKLVFEHNGTTITVHLNRIRGDRVTVGIEAPQQVRVVRGELKKKESA